ncbi:MAG: hypothetical protein OXC02_05545, partial [Rhodobacteraceae bacterium]|nr:hypothetical protein [Paracoccaceae bacterium]
RYFSYFDYVSDSCGHGSFRLIIFTSGLRTQHPDFDPIDLVEIIPLFRILLTFCFSICEHSDCSVIVSI